METLVRTPQTVFMLPQRLMVPLFQRPYVWTEDDQWEPLWSDVTRVAERLLQRPTEKPRPHFLGAVVLQQVQVPVGLMQQRTIIDGQQRLTTLQLLLDALHAQLRTLNQEQPALRIEQLVANPVAFCNRAEDRFKVWPTNRDRDAFNAVMGATPPVDYEATGHAGAKMVQAHRFFSGEAAKWLAAEGADRVSVRAAAIEAVLRDHLQMVVIDLGVDENAQEIFETLNARGAQLTAADLIKNFVFQRLLDSEADVEEAYQRDWREFEAGFWEERISVGRVRESRSSVFLNHWLTAQTGDEILGREVFNRFKSHAYDQAIPMTEFLQQIRRAAAVYRQFITAASAKTGPMDRLSLFGYRTGALESEVIKPLVLWLHDPELPEVPGTQMAKALDAVESWMVRRMLVRATTKNYNQAMAELIALLRTSPRPTAGETIERFLAGQTSASRYWPDNDEIRNEVRGLQAYRRISRGRLRMVLEAIEDHKRGFRDGKDGLGGERVARGVYAIEHIMPRKWVSHWPPSPGFRGEGDRDQLIHTLGNLTLLTSKLNTKVSNGPWDGEGGKRGALQDHCVLFLNRHLLQRANDAWSDEGIRARTDELAHAITEIWPVPDGHKSTFVEKTSSKHSMVGLAELINAGLLQSGMPLYPRTNKHPGQVATLLPDGQIDVDGTVFKKVSRAAAAIMGKPTSGWWFFLVDKPSRRSLRDVWRQYVDSRSVDADDDDADGDGADDDE